MFADCSAAGRRLGIVLTVALAGCLQGGPALAQGTAEERSACEGDAFKFCLSDIPSVSAIEACLKANKAQLSPACQAEFSGPTPRTKLRREHFRK